jgi:hypothetical protein
METDTEKFTPGDVYGRSLKGFGVNLLVKDVLNSIEFQVNVLGAEAVFGNKDFAVMRYQEHQWMLHADHTYHSNPLPSLISGDQARGAGIELRLYDVDPAEAAAKASSFGGGVLQEPSDKPHGLHEAYLYDADGYVWIPSVHIKA